MYRGFYINLDRNLDRRSHVEKQIAAYNLQSRYTRFPACLGNALNVKAASVINPGAIGCFCSHYTLLKSQIDAPAHLHITEDDIVFSPFIASALDTMIDKGTLASLDMLYTDMFIPLDVHQVRELAGRFRQSTVLNEDGTVKTLTNLCLLHLQNRVFACTSSYLVNKDSIAKIAGLLEEAVRSEITAPIDLFYRQKIHQGQIAAGCVFPFITTVDTRLTRLSNINQDTKNLETSRLAADFLRNLFFVNSKPRELLADCKSSLLSGPTDDRDKVLNTIYRFALSPNYELF